MRAYSRFVEGLARSGDGVPREQWEEIWDQPITEIRSDLGVEPFVSPYPAELLELIRNS